MLTRTRLAVVVCGLILASLTGHNAQAQAQPNRLVTSEPGDLPIILSAPHGGREAIVDAPVRLGKGVARFVTSTDARTDLLTEKLADSLEQKLGKRPYVVIARVQRKYVDANRPATGAYESELGKVAYDTYHRALADAREKVVQRWGRGLLLDIHGQVAEPKAIFRGTQNGKTAEHLVQRFGPAALLGETSLFGQLAKQGFPVIPAIDSSDREHAAYNGGYIVATYGSGSGGTLDAIQLELGSELRSSQAMATTADKLATAVTAFATKYLPQEEQAAAAQHQPPRTAKVRVGVYTDEGAGKSVALKSALQKSEDVAVKELTAEEIRSGALAELDVLIHPGGSGGAQGRCLEEAGREEIRKFVREGGGYIGICAGAYLASADYEWSLNILDAKVLDRKHWARGRGMVEIELSDVGQQVLKSTAKQRAIYYAQGPLLAPGNRPDITDYQTMATFKTEIAKNGAPQGVMPGTTAIARGEYGLGRVVCFSPHPELTKGLATFVLEAITDVKRK